MLAWDTKSESSQVYLHSSNHAKLQLTAKGVDGKRLNSFADRRVGIDVVPVHSIEYMKDFPALDTKFHVLCDFDQDRMLS